MVRSKLYNYSDTYIFKKGRITVTGGEDGASRSLH